MQEITAEFADGSVGNDMLVNRVVAPSCVRAVEKTHDPVGVALAMAQPSAKKAIASRHCECSVARVFQRIPYRRGELRRHSFIGIEAKDPVMACLRHCEVL